MLILTRRTGESVFVFHKDNYKDVEMQLILLGTKGNQSRIGIAATDEYTILREEIYKQIAQEKGINVHSYRYTKEEIIAATQKRIENRKILLKARKDLRCLEV